MPRKTTKKKRTYTSDDLVIETHGSRVFVNGREVLAGRGKSEIGRKRIRDAVRKVISQRRSA
jgi:hypothetical protein